MKLSEFKGEDAIQVIADVLEPFSVIASDKQFVLMASNKPYMETAKYVLRNFKNEILEIYEILTKEKKEEATPVTLLKFVTDVIEDEDLMSLFFSQSQNEPLTSSGSATENTEDGLR